MKNDGYMKAVGKLAAFFHWEGVRGFALQHWILPWRYILNSTMAALNVRYNVVFANFSQLIDAKSVVISCRVHARKWIPDTVREH